MAREKSKNENFENLWTPFLKANSKKTFFYAEYMNIFLSIKECMSKNKITTWVNWVHTEYPLNKEYIT